MESFIWLSVGELHGVLEMTAAATADGLFCVT